MKGIIEHKKDFFSPLTPVNGVKMQLRAVFTQHQYPGSGRTVVVWIIWNVPFSFLSEKGHILLAGAVLYKSTAHGVSQVWNCI